VRPTGPVVERGAVVGHEHEQHRHRPSEVDATQS
jgi:hypothetical protein